MEVYIFGAGASHAASNKNTPLGADLGWDYARSCCRHMFETDGHGNILPSATEEANKSFAPFIRFLLILGKYYPNIKKEISKIEEANKKGMQYLDPFTSAKYSGNYLDWIKDAKKYCIDEFIIKIINHNNLSDLAGIKRFIFEHIVESSIIWSCQDNNLYKKFIDNFIYGKKPEEIKIISFNYDTLLANNYSDKNIYFKYHIDEEHNFINEYGFDLGNAYSIYKLHGSINWWYCNECQTIHIKDIYGSFACNKCKSIMSPLIRAPREDSNSILSELFDKAKKELESASKIYIIGYSLPEYDKEEFMNLCENIPGDTEINIVDFCGETEAYDLRYKAINDKFSDALKKDVIVDLSGFEEHILKK